MPGVGTAAAGESPDESDAGVRRVALERVEQDQGLGDAPRQRSRSTRLSRRERLILANLAHGSTTEEIAGVLDVSPHTVRTHIKNAMRKLDARTRAHAVAIALCDGAIEYR